jgi:hypothetical protein
MPCAAICVRNHNTLDIVLSDLSAAHAESNSRLCMSSQRPSYYPKSSLQDLVGQVELACLMDNTTLPRKVEFDWYFCQLAFDSCTGRINPPHEGFDRLSDVWPCQMLQVRPLPCRMGFDAGASAPADSAGWAAQGRESDVARKTGNL